MFLLQQNADKWHIVFFIAAAIYAACDLFYVIFGSGEIQKWNGEKSKEDVISKFQIKDIKFQKFISHSLSFQSQGDIRNQLMLIV